jgi:hypothetical protein
LGRGHLPQADSRETLVRSLVANCSHRSAVARTLRCRRRAAAAHAQIAISALGDAAKDRAITRRHLLRHQTKPWSKITPFRKGDTRLRARRERPRCRCAADERDELAAFQVIELLSVPCQPGPDCRISNWLGSVSGYQMLRYGTVLRLPPRCARFVRPVRFCNARKSFHPVTLQSGFPARLSRSYNRWGQERLATSLMSPSTGSPAQKKRGFSRIK